MWQKWAQDMRYESELLNELDEKWSAMSLVRQFAIASFLTVFIGMASTAMWVSSRIESGVVSNSALSAALFMDSFIAPLLQGLDQSQQLSDESRQALGELIDHAPLGEQVMSYKIWAEDGVIVHSSNKELIGKQFPVTDTLNRAWAGDIQAEFDRLDDEEDVVEKTFKVPLLEVYSPIRNSAGKIIAVSEFYANAEQLERDLYLTGFQSWILFGVAGLTMFAALSGIALRGSHTIENQQSALKKRVSELSDLRKRLQRASRRSTELNEGFLRRIGADLHDGPAQLIAFALLRLEELSSESKTPNRRAEVSQSIKEPLQDALTEIRSLSSGLMLPGFNGMTTQEVMDKAADSHQNRTGMKIYREYDLQLVETYLPESILICVYRFVQETLNNSFQHSQNMEVFLSARLNQNQFVVAVLDHGVGFVPSHVERENHCLGLAGLRERIESVGGDFTVLSNLGKGTEASASFTLETHSEECN